MRPVSARLVEREVPLRGAAHEERVARLEAVEPQAQLTAGDAFQEELEIGLQGRGRDRVGSLEWLLAVGKAERRELARAKLEPLFGPDPKDPEIRPEIAPLRDLRGDMSRGDRIRYSDGEPSEPDESSGFTGESCRFFVAT
jgi:hypothetical protein